MSGNELPLPEKLAEIAEVAGREAALDLALHMRGTRLHVPSPANLGADHPLARAVGLIAARLIADRFKGESIYVPKANRALVRHLHARGVAAGDIAARLGITKSAVWRYRQGFRSPW